MSQQNADLMKSLYAAFGRGDVPTVLGAMDPAIVWNEAEGFPCADKNPYVGPNAVLEGVFVRLGSGKLRGGKIVSFQQYTDTLQVSKAVSG